MKAQGQGKRNDVEENEPGRIEEGALGKDFREGPWNIMEGRIFRALVRCRPVGDDYINNGVLVPDDFPFQTAFLPDPRAGDLAGRVEEPGRGGDAVDVPGEADQPLELAPVILLHPVVIVVDRPHVAGPISALEAQKDLRVHVCWRFSLRARTDGKLMNCPARSGPRLGMMKTRRVQRKRRTTMDLPTAW